MNRPKSAGRTLTLALVTLCALSCGLSVSAATTLTWTGQGADNNWGSAANWLPVQQPVAGDTLVFPANAAQTIANNNLLNASFSSITIMAGGYTLGGNPVALTSPGPALTASTSAGATIVNISITAVGGLSSATTGSSLTLGGASSFGGSVLIADGTLILASDLSVTGGLTLGAAPGSTSAPSLDMSLGNATFGGSMLVQYNSAAGGMITIGSAKALTVNNNVTVGFMPASRDQPTKLTIAGAGSFIVNNPAAVFQLGGAVGTGMAAGNTNFSNKVTLDMSGLATFTAKVQLFHMGDNNDSGTAAQTFGVCTVILAGSSTITAPNLTVSDNGYQVAHVLKLGNVSNVFNVDSFNIGTGTRSSGSVGFNSAAGTLTIRDFSGTGRAALNIATGGSSTGSAAPNDDFTMSGHSVDLKLSTLSIFDQARHSNHGVAVTVDAGTLDATSIKMGRRTTNFISGGTVTCLMTIGGSAAVFVGAAASRWWISNQSWTRHPLILFSCSMVVRSPSAATWSRFWVPARRAQPLPL